MQLYISPWYSHFLGLNIFLFRTIALWRQFIHARIHAVFPFILPMKQRLGQLIDGPSCRTISASDASSICVVLAKLTVNSSATVANVIHVEFILSCGVLCVVLLPDFLALDGGYLEKMEKERGEKKNFAVLLNTAQDGQRRTQHTQKKAIKEQ